MKIFRNKREKGKFYFGETPELTLFLTDPTVDGLVGSVMEGHALTNYGFQEEIRDFMLHLLHGLQGIHLRMGGLDSKALHCWNWSLNKKKGRLN